MTDRRTILTYTNAIIRKGEFVDNVITSIERAQKLLNKTDIVEKYVSIKLKPMTGGCCCFHCWPRTWSEINREISNYGILEDEGDILIGDDNERFVLECHESGPEIIVYLGVGVATLNFVTSIINIIYTIIKNRQHEKVGAKFIITKRNLKKSKVIEETIMQISYPLSKDDISLLNTKISEIMEIHLN